MLLTLSHSIACRRSGMGSNFSFDSFNSWTTATFDTPVAKDGAGRTYGVAMTNPVAVVLRNALLSREKALVRQRQAVPNRRSVVWMKFILCQRGTVSVVVS